MLSLVRVAAKVRRVSGYEWPRNQVFCTFTSYCCTFRGLPAPGRRPPRLEFRSRGLLRITANSLRRRSLDNFLRPARALPHFAALENKRTSFSISVYEKMSLLILLCRAQQGTQFCAVYPMRLSFLSRPILICGSCPSPYAQGLL